MSRNNIKQQNHFKKSSKDEFDDDSLNVSKKWYEEISYRHKDFKPVADEILVKLKNEAKKCHDAEVIAFKTKNSKMNSDYQWIKGVMTKGTVADKTAAYTVLIQDNPLSNLDAIMKLVSMVKVGKKKECISVMETLTELFLNDLLCPDRKLIPFQNQPLYYLDSISSGNLLTRRKYLSFWYFEDQLKETFTSFVLALNKAAHDTVESNKEKAISAMYQLLAGNPEQEKNLLSYIINKLGDPSRKVASKTIYCLNELLHKHSNMQGVVLTEVEKLLFRANVSSRAQYYGLCFLSQFYLCEETSEIAKRLITVYFSFFKACIKKGDVDSRMMSVLLMGVNRAYPYGKLELNKISEHIDTMYRVVHLASFNVSLHALTLLLHVCDHANDVNDRFYSALYKKLFDSQIATTTHHAMLLNLIYKALLKDKEITRVKAFIKRLLQLSLHMQAPFVCGLLFLISRLLNANKELCAFKSHKNDIEDGDDDKEAEEKYFDIKDENDVVKEEIVSDAEENETTTMQLHAEIPEASWYHCTTKTIKTENVHKSITNYNHFCRNPLYCGGEFAWYSELHNLSMHFHPTIALYASNLLRKEDIKYSGDPLQDFTLIRFLDRFAFKNPKKTHDTKSGAHPTFGARKTYIPKGIRSLPVNSAVYLNEKETNIPANELFLYKYLQKRHQEKGDEEDNSDADSVGSEEFEEMLGKMPGFPKDDNEIDFLNNIGDTFKVNDKKKKKGVQDNVNDDEDENFEDDIDETEDNIDEMEDDIDEIEDDIDEIEDDDSDEIEDGEDMPELDDSDASDIAFDSDGEIIESDASKTKNRKGKKGLNNDITPVFASADEFATLLEGEGNSKSGGSNVFSNKDGANVKQVEWEKKRNHWVTGYNKFVGRGGKKFNNKSGQTKRSNTSKFGNKNKKSKI